MAHSPPTPRRIAHPTSDPAVDPDAQPPQPRAKTKPSRRARQKRRPLALVRRCLFVPGLTLALLASAALIASLWHISYRRVHARSDFSLSMSQGELWITTGGTYYGPGLHALRAPTNPTSVTKLTWWPYDGRFFTQYSTRFWSLRLPIWMPLVLGLTLTSLTARPWLDRRIQQRRADRGLCPDCGYDRAGLPLPSAPCPECGAEYDPPHYLITIESPRAR